MRPTVISRIGLLACLVPLGALAQDDHEALGPTEVEVGAGALTLTISGGGSLGMYQAGQLYYMSEVVKANPDLPNFSTLTGTSAGAINAFVGLLTVCSDPVPDPRDSAAYQTWIDVGIGNLYVPEAVEVDGVFDREAGLGHAVELLHERWNAGLPETCTVTWGAATSRLLPRRVPVTSVLDAPMGLEHFAVRVQGRGPGRTPKVTPVVDREAAYPQAVLPLADENADAFGLIEQVVYASSAFPVGFKPVEIPYCLRDPSADDLKCKFDEIETALFVDGGAFDNTPIRLAVRLARQAGAERPMPIYVDAYLGRFPEAPPTDERAARRQTLDGLIELVGGVMDSAKRQQLITLIEEDADIADRLVLSLAFTPQAGREVYSFMALFDRRLREFDFYLGAYSAHRQVVDRGSAIRLMDLKLPEDLPGRDAGWAPFHCMQATLEGPEGTEACLAPESRELAPLIQTSIERLYAWCKATPDGLIAGVPSEHCAAARAGSPPPLVHGLPGPVGADWDIHPGEHALSHALRRMAHHGFVFEDLGEKTPHARKSAHAMRHTLKRMVRKLASVNGGQDLLIRIGGSVLVDDLVPVPEKPLATD